MSELFIEIVTEAVFLITSFLLITTNTPLYNSNFSKFVNFFLRYTDEHHMNNNYGLIFYFRYNHYRR